MVGIILSGGLGTRMGYYTHRVTNKHLCYVYNRAMIDYPLVSLVEAGVKDVVVVTGGRHGGAIMDYLGNGKEFGLRTLNYARQYGEGGIADALRCAKPFAKGSKVFVILGDNLFEDNLKDALSTENASVFLKEVENPSAYGVATIVGDRITKVVEKPKIPESKWAITGAYVFDSDVFDIIETLKPSQRGELEVTDIIQHYLNAGRLKHHYLKGYWTDLGSPETLLAGSNFIAKNHDHFAAKFKAFDINISLPLSVSQADQLREWVDADPEKAKALLASHSKQCRKWDV
jgi:glucose-1-phosphate thymidylyltransferase